MANVYTEDCNVFGTGATVSCYTKSEIDEQNEKIEDNIHSIENDITSLYNSKSDKTTVITNNSAETEISLVMEHNTEKRYSELITLNISIPEDFDDYYISSVIFTSGDAATNFTYPAIIKMTGTDCDEDNIFVPIPNERYTIILSYDGEGIAGTVSGIKK